MTNRRRAWCLIGCLAACARADTTVSPELIVVGESTRIRLEDPWPPTTAWFDGNHVTLAAARGETVGIQVLHRSTSAVMLSFRGEAGIRVAAFDVGSFAVRRPSTAMYGGSKGRGTYPDVLTPATAPTTNPAYFEIAVDPSSEPGTVYGELVAGDRRIVVSLQVTRAQLGPLPISAWAYEDPRELAWAQGFIGEPPRAKPTQSELRCIATFRSFGVLLSPDIHLDWWRDRRALMAGVRDVPVWIPSEPTEAADAVRAWIAELRGTGQVPFAIPVDEPRSLDKQRRVFQLSNAVRAAGGGRATFQYALTDNYRPEHGGLVDLYLTPYARLDDPFPRWTYNGAPPHAGSMVLDAATPGTRTWGWIAWRWHIATWYIWDALYWHDRHNRNGAPLPGKELVPSEDPVSFDDGDDHGNLDGVLALPTPDGCQPTLRLAAMRRGFLDKLLLEKAATCAPAATARLAERVVPRALGDASHGSATSWSLDESHWEAARRELLQLASCAE